MSIKALLAKIMEVDGVAEALGTEGVEALKAFDDGSSVAADLAKLQEELKAEKGKAGGILDEKKKAQSKVDELSKRIEELENSGLSDGEKLTKELETAKAALIAANEKTTELESTLASTNRSHALGQIGAGIKWLDTVPAEMRRNAVEMAFADVTDLSDESKVKEVSDVFLDSVKGLIQAEGVPNGGPKPTSNSPAGSGLSLKPVEKQTAEEREAHLAAQRNIRR